MGLLVRVARNADETMTTSPFSGGVKRCARSDCASEATISWAPVCSAMAFMRASGREVGSVRANVPSAFITASRAIMVQRLFPKHKGTYVGANGNAA